MCQVPFLFWKHLPHNWAARLQPSRVHHAARMMPAATHTPAYSSQRSSAVSALDSLRKPKPRARCHLLSCVSSSLVVWFLSLHISLHLCQTETDRHSVSVHVCVSVSVLCLCLSLCCSMSIVTLSDMCLFITSCCLFIKSCWRSACACHVLHDPCPSHAA